MIGSKKICLIAIGLVALIAMIFVWQLSAYFEHRGLTKVKILVVPSDSRLTIDNKPSKPGVTYLASGSHRLVASKQDFGDDIESINTADLGSNQTIYMLPTVTSAEAKNYLQQHPDVQAQRESAGGAEAERLSALLLKKHPVLAKLPQETLDYKIDYSTGSNQNITLTITTYGIINGPADYTQYIQQTKDYRQEALDFLQKNGVGANSLKINYIPAL